MIRALLVVGLAGLIASPVLAQEAIDKRTKADLIRAAREFEECAGFWFAWEDVLLAEFPDELADEAQLSQDTARGASVASAWLFATLGVMEWKEALGYAEQQAQTRRVHWRARFRTDLDSPAVTTQRDLCKRLAPLQETLVDQAMEWALMNQPKPGETKPAE